VQIIAGDSTGSGVVYDSNGDIVTNAHVVGDVKTVDVLPASGQATLKADVIGTFPPDDLAVIKVTSGASELKPAKFADSDDASIGEIVLAMGNPLGLTDSVTQGIVSATGRTVSEGTSSGSGGTALITSAIQTSAAINPGNSGGALVDLQNQVVGIPTLAARLPDSGGSGAPAPGIGFAIPSNTVKNIADQLIKYGKVTTSDRSSLDITAQTAANSSGQSVGVAVVDVAPGGAADKAGIVPGDVITSINSVPTPGLQDLQSELGTLKPGTKVTVVYKRDGVSHSTSVTLGSLGS
jgi:S1-C subfamily serine protease